MVTLSQSTLVLLLGGAVLLGIALYDFVATVVLTNNASKVLTTRHNYPIRLAIIGLLAIVGAGVWLFMSNWILGVVLVAGAILTIVGLVWHNANH